MVEQHACHLGEQTSAIMTMVTDQSSSLSKAASTTMRNCVYSFDEFLLVDRLVYVKVDKAPTLQKIVTKKESDQQDVTML